MTFSLRFLLICSLFFLVDLIRAQDPQTIRVRRESNLVKAEFDNTELRLFAIDRFGNPKENKVASYKLYVKTKKETKQFDCFLRNVIISGLN